MCLFDKVLRLCTALLSVSPLWATPALAANASDTEWPTYGNDAGGSRYADVDQITPSNVAELVRAWTYRTGDLGDGFPSRERMAFEATPILLNGVLYLSTPYGQVHAVSAATGEGLWRYDPDLSKDRRYAENTSRGVSAWRDPNAPVDARCALRILFGTLGARLVALDAATGTPCNDFGQGGTVDLNQGTRPRDAGNYLSTSPPVIWQNPVITSSAIGDNRAVDSELGIVRGFDTQTGALIWTWDPALSRCFNLFLSIRNDPCCGDMRLLFIDLPFRRWLFGTPRVFSKASQVNGGDQLS